MGKRKKFKGGNDLPPLPEGVTVQKLPEVSPSLNLEEVEQEWDFLGREEKLQIWNQFKRENPSPGGYMWFHEEFYKEPEGWDAEGNAVDQEIMDEVYEFLLANGEEEHVIFVAKVCQGRDLSDNQGHYGRAIDRLRELGLSERRIKSCIK